MAQNINNYSCSEIIRLLYLYIARRIKIPQTLSILAILTFGLGDALTGAIMMDIRGFGGEANLLVAYIYASLGLGGLIAFKIMVTLILLFAAFVMYQRSGGKNYWMINGFLISITILGAMATISNIQAALGLSFMHPENIIAIFIGILLILVEAGDILDNRMAQTGLAEASRARYPWQNYRKV
jgi:hypothetical protein